MLASTGVSRTYRHWLHRADVLQKDLRLPSWEGKGAGIDMLIGRLQGDRIYKYAGKGNWETLLQAAKLQALRTYTHMENKQGGKER